MVGSSGLEPPTSRLSGARSNHLSYEPIFGGDKEARTPDPLLAKQVLSQLSYTPNCHHEVFLFFLPSLNQDLVMVGLGRLELPTSRLSGVRSNHLSYKPFAI